MRSYHPAMMRAGTVIDGIRAAESWAAQYSSWSGWASQSSPQPPLASSGWSATGVASLRASGSSRAWPSRIIALGSVVSPRSRARCSPRVYMRALQLFTRLRERAPPGEYQSPEYQFAAAKKGAIAFRAGGSPTAMAHWVMPMYETPKLPTVPSDQSCAAIQATVSTPSAVSLTLGSKTPSEAKVPRTSCRTTAYPALTNAMTEGPPPAAPYMPVCRLL
jgi:hypothetical protein